MSENTVFRKIFGPSGAGGGNTGVRRLHNDELYDLYSTLDIIRMSTSRRMRFVRHEARMRKKVLRGFWWGNPRARDNLKDLGVDGRIIINWIFK
jgi:hypothetical protein